MLIEIQKIFCKHLLFQPNTVSNPLDFFDFSQKSLTIQLFWADLSHRKLHLGWFQPQLLKFPGVPASAISEKFLKTFPEFEPNFL